jgi:hypothetical protein
MEETLQRPKKGCEDNIKKDLKKYDMRTYTVYTGSRQSTVSSSNNEHLGSIKGLECFEQLTITGSSRNILS